jgi:DNA-binding response OmpR family regulator
MVEPPPSVLFVHPDPDARENRVAAARQLGFLAGAAANASQELEALSHRGVIPDVIVFDDVTNDMSPAQFAEELLRRLGDAAPPVVYILTPQRGETSIPSPPLRSGVDVVLQRPVRARDALSATLSCLRRSASAASVLHAGELDFDAARRVLSFQGRSVKLTKFESLLLEYLMRRAGRPVPIDELLERLWGFEPGTGACEVVRAHVRNLRNKFQAIGASRELIQTLPGRGYMLDAPPDVPAFMSTTL